jgi:hypothetical protein
MRENDIPANSMHRPEVLNGIAYDEATGELWITGKRWPKVCWCPVRYSMQFVGEWRMMHRPSCGS